MLCALRALSGWWGQADRGEGFAQLLIATSFGQPLGVYT